MLPASFNTSEIASDSVSKVKIFAFLKNFLATISPVTPNFVTIVYSGLSKSAAVLILVATPLSTNSVCPITIYGSAKLIC